MKKFGKLLLLTQGGDKNLYPFKSIGKMNFVWCVEEIELKNTTLQCTKTSCACY